MKTFTIKTLGCKVSRYDAERIAAMLKLKGLVENDKAPDLYILNGCSVTSRASQKVRQTLRAAKRKWPDAKIVLAGCEARLREQKNIATGEADSVLTNAFDDNAISEMLKSLGLDAASSGKSQDIKICPQTRAFFKVQDGCSQFCSYCIVPYLRGNEWSCKIEDAVHEAEILVKEGHKEIVLTGIHIGHYKPSLVELTRALDKIPDLNRIRISSIESIEVTDDLIAWMANSKNACKHFHLPLQSGCDRILKLMKRPYLTKDFKDIVNKIRILIPDIAISTDLIVGFPGETEEDFEQTLSFIKEINFSRIHIFRYSKRDGTPAAKMPNQLSNQVKHERASKVKAVWHDSELKFLNNFINKRIEILWETCKDGYWHGFSREYVPCVIKTDENIGNTITMARGICINDKKYLLVELES